VPKVQVVLRPQSHASTYFRKAEEFCLAASQELELGRFDASLLSAVHAGISSADAVCVALGGRRSRDADHLRAADLLEEIAANSPPIREKANQLRALIRQKNRVEYEDKPASRSDAVDAVRRCGRLIEWARSELMKAGVLART
jgi:HEPN domain-containing protein